VKVLVHRAVFLPTSPEQYFVKVVNMSKRREIEITHIWIETTPGIHPGNPAVHCPPGFVQTIPLRPGFRSLVYLPAPDVERAASRLRGGAWGAMIRAH